jgi:hypothetical protein
MPTANDLEARDQEMSRFVKDGKAKLKELIAKFDKLDGFKGSSEYRGDAVRFLRETGEKVDALLGRLAKAAG